MVSAHLLRDKAQYLKYISQHRILPQNLIPNLSGLLLMYCKNGQRHLHGKSCSSTVVWGPGRKLSRHLITTESQSS